MSTISPALTERLDKDVTAGGLGFLNALAPTRQYLRTLLWPTLLGSVLGAVLLLQTGERAFQVVVPFLILGATLLLAFQSRIKAFSLRHSHEMPPAAAAVLQFLVSVYGGYFGAGMGIMMLAVFTLYMEGNLHEMNAAKNWLGLLINFVATGVFLLRGHIVVGSAVALAIGAVLGGFAAARWSQRVDPERLRPWIAAYGFAAAAYFMARTWA